MNIFWFLICVVICVEGASKLPYFLDQCYINDPDLANCLIRNIEKIKLQFVNGPIPELHIPYLYPLLITSASYYTDNIKLNMKNLTLWYMDSLTVIEVKFDRDELDLRFYYPYIFVEADADVSGTLVGLELDSYTTGAVNSSNVMIDYKVKLDKVTQRGEDHFKIKESAMKYKMMGFAAYAENLFKDVELNAIANNNIYSNQELVIPQFEPIFAELLRKVFDNIVDNILNTYSIKILLPEKQ